jgi:hypothetical protein
VAAGCTRTDTERRTALALAHLWLSRGAPGSIEYLRFRDGVSETAEALAKAGSLTPDGERFVALMFAAVRDDQDPGA